MKLSKYVSTLVLFMPFAVMADEVGHGGPNGVDPDATEPGTPTTSSTETESTWFDDLLALFDLEEEGDE